MQKTPLEFLEQAKKIEHPMSPVKVIPEVLKQAIFDNLTRDPIELAKSRVRAIGTIKEMAQNLQVQTIGTIKEMAQNLQVQKTGIKQQCEPEIAAKRIALWEALLKASEFPDMDIVTVVK